MISALNINSKIDPTQTTVLRNLFSNEMNKRFNGLVRIIKKAIVEDNCFGGPHTIQSNFNTPGVEAFAFLTSSEKVVKFMDWLQTQIDAGILDIRELQQVGIGVNGAWTNKYIFDSYKRGVIRARYELKKAGFTVPSIDQSGGIDVSLMTPFSIDRLALLYTRTYNELKGITEQMDTLISRVLAQGMADGDNPILIARKLVSVVNGQGVGDLSMTDSLGRFIPAQRRAEMLARTEIIRAHHVATISEYRNWAIHGVIVKGEWATAGDDRVCPQCEALQGKVFSLDQIEGMIPAHPMCRCIALPYLVE